MSGWIDLLGCLLLFGTYAVLYVFSLNSNVFGSIFCEILGFGDHRLTFSRKRVNGRFGWPLGRQNDPPHHALGRLGLHVGRHFSKID